MLKMFREEEVLTDKYECVYYPHGKPNLKSPAQEENRDTW